MSSRYIKIHEYHALWEIKIDQLLQSTKSHVFENFQDDSKKAMTNEKMGSCNFGLSKFDRKLHPLVGGNLI